MVQLLVKDISVSDFVAMKSKVTTLSILLNNPHFCIHDPWPLTPVFPWTV